MFHLFDRVYMAPIDALDLNMPRIVIDKDYSEMAEGNLNTPSIYHWTDDRDPTLDDFISAVARASQVGSKVYIYTSREMYITAMYLWVRTLMKSYSLSEFKVLWTIHLQSLSSIHTSHRKQLSEISLDDLSDAFSEAETMNISSLRKIQISNLSKVSLEYKIGDYLKANDISLIRGDVSNITRRAVAQHFAETLRDMKTSIYSAKQAELLGYDIDDVLAIGDLDSVQPLFTKLRFFSKPELWPESDMPTLNPLTEEQVKDLKHDIKYLAVHSIPAGREMLLWMGSFIDLAVKRSTELTKDDVDTFLNALGDVSMDLSFIPTPDLKKINQVFIYRVLNNEDAVLSYYEIKK